MSFIAASGAKSLAQSYLGEHSFDAFGSAGAGMAANAANYITDTQEGAKRDYITEIGQTKLDGIKKVGGAQMAANNDAFMGNMFALGGQAAMGVSSFGQKNWGWGKNG